jgi:hypothetical protein
MLCLLALDTYASGNKNKDDVNIKIDIHTDKKGNVSINGSVKDVKAIEDWVNKCLNDVSVEVNDGGNKKIKNLKLSLSIKEK